MTSDPNPRLFVVYGIKLPSDIGITGQYNDPYQPRWNVTRVLLDKRSKSSNHRGSTWLGYIYIFIFINMHIYIFLYHNIDMYTSENKHGPTKMVFWKKINLWGVWVSMFVFGGVCLLSHEGIKELQICDMSMTSIVWTHNSTFVERCRNIWRWTKTTPTKHVAVLFLASSMCVSRGMFCSFGIILWIESVTVWKCLLSK